MSLDPNKTYLVWNGTKFPNSTNAKFKAPARSTIDWGDGKSEEFSTETAATHTYDDGKTEHTIAISGLTSIGQNAFKNCSSLTSVTIPDSVTSIGWNAFDGCSSLTSVTIPNSVMSIGWYAFYGCSSLRSITIPDGVTYISPDTFYGCSSLTSVTIGNSVTDIGRYAFKDCSKLTQLILFPSTPPTLASDSIPSTVQSIYVPQSSKAAYQAATNWTAFATEPNNKIVSDNIYLSFIRFNQKNKEYINGKVNELSAAANLKNGTGTGSLVQKTVSSSGTPYANEASGSGAVAMGKKVKSKGNATFVTGQENEAIAGTSASFTSGRLNVNRGSYNITGGENNANNNSWNLVIGKGNAVSDGRFGIVSGLDNVFTGLGSDENSAVSMLGKNLYVQYSMPSDGALLIGRYNRVQNNPGRLFIVGNGTSKDDRKNAFEVLEDGRAKIQTTPSEIDDVVNKGYVDGSGMQGTGDPPLQGYNKNKGTIEKRLTDLGFKPLQADITTKSINVSGATYNGSIGTMLLQVGRVTYRQGNMASLALNIAFASQSLGTSESNQFYEFYFNSAEATVSDIIPKNYRPTSNYIFTVYSRINMELRSGSDTLVTKIQDAIPIKCTVKTSGDITLQIYAPLTASNGSGVINYSKTRREIVGTNRGFNIGYPVNPYV